MDGKYFPMPKINLAFQNSKWHRARLNEETNDFILQTIRDLERRCLCTGVQICARKINLPHFSEAPASAYFHSTDCPGSTASREGKPSLNLLCDDFSVAHHKLNDVICEGENYARTCKIR